MLKTGYDNVLITVGIRFSPFPRVCGVCFGLVVFFIVVGCCCSGNLPEVYKLRALWFVFWACAFPWPCAVTSWIPLYTVTFECLSLSLNVWLPGLEKQGNRGGSRHCPLNLLEPTSAQWGLQQWQTAFVSASPWSKAVIHSQHPDPHYWEKKVPIATLAPKGCYRNASMAASHGVRG